jgi:hypothetical protein
MRRSCRAENTVFGGVQLYEMLADNRLTAVKIGGSTKVLATEVERYLATLPTVPAKIGRATA